MKIIPEVQNQELLEGVYTFSSEYYFDKERFPKAYKYLGSFVKVLDNKSEINCTIDSNLKNEEYILEIDNKISVVAKNEEGIFRAFSTLKQLMAHKTVQKQKIHDYPMIKNRGFMLDVSRGKIPKVETIFEYIDILRDLKYNQFQLYIDGLFFQYKNFKKYLKDGTYITIEEIKKIAEYCSSNFIDLIPTQNGFGHMSDWLKIPEFKELGITRNDDKELSTVNPLDKRTLNLMNAIYDDCLPYYNSKYVNICMDEPFGLGMGQTKEECEKKGKETVYVEYLNKIISLCNEKYGLTPMFFDDAVIENDTALDKVSKDSIVMVWGYEMEWPYSGRCELLQRKNRRFYVCPSTCTFGSITGRFTNMAFNIESAVKNCIMYGGEGMLLTEWGDYGHPQCMAMSFISLIYAASCSWNFNVTREFVPVSHLAYDRSKNILEDCEDYADKFIFKKDGVSSLVRLMQNYYIMENHTKWSGTYTASDARYIGSERPYHLKKLNANIIICYMENIKKELLKYDKNVPHIEDIMLNCDTVILFAKIVSEFDNKKRMENGNLKAEINELKEKFVKLWNIKNRDFGYDIFTGYLDTILNKFD